jgi:hypothetical protein
MTHQNHFVVILLLRKPGYRGLLLISKNKPSCHRQKNDRKNLTLHRLLLLAIFNSAKLVQFPFFARKRSLKLTDLENLTFPFS